MFGFSPVTLIIIGVIVLLIHRARRNKSKANINRKQEGEINQIYSVCDWANKKPKKAKRGDPLSFHSYTPAPFTSFNRSSINNNDFFTHSNLFNNSHNDIEINPASGLPMMGSLDIEGNPYGFDDSSFTGSSFDHDDF